jgi:hypothetical protein
MPEFGVLTLATDNDYLKAIGLALSLRVTNPAVPLAIACNASVAEKAGRFFDHVIPEQAGLRGFVHKVYLDRYSPFERTLFLDSDVLVFKDLQPYVERWKGRAYCACGGYLSDGVSPFGLDRAMVLSKIGKDRLVFIDGAGHAYFEKPACVEVFETGRRVTEHYRELAGDIRYADEDVMAIAMTMLGLPPASDWDFLARYLSARPGTMRMDATAGVCEFIAATTGRPFAPCIVHFAANEAAVPYTRQLLALFEKFDAPTEGLWTQGVQDWWAWNVRLPVHRAATWARGRLGRA